MDIRINNAVYTVDKVSRPAILMEENDGVNSDYYWQPFFVYGKLPNNIKQTGVIEFTQGTTSSVVHYDGYNLEKDGCYRFTVKYCDKDMSKIRILCLDIDGVCNSETFYAKRANGEYGDKPYPLSEFDPKAVAQVNRIIEETGAKLVISSSWRFTEGLRNIMEQVGFSKKCFDFEITPYLGTIRGLEIKKYIEEYPDKHNGEEIETYCIVDDDIDMLYEQKDNFVKTDAYYGGLTKEKADEVIRILNNDGFVQHERINVDTGYQELLSVKNGDDCSSICVFKMEPKEIININNEEVFRTIEITVKELYGYLENKPLPFKMKYDNEGYLQVSVKVKQSTEENRDIFKKVLTGKLFDKPWRYINISYLK